MSNGKIDPVRRTLSECYHLCNDSGDAYISHESFMTRCRTDAGCGIPDYKIDKTPNKFLSDILSEPFNERKALLCALEIVHIARDYCFNFPAELADSVDKYIPHSTPDNWSQKLLKSIVDVIRFDHELYQKKAKNMTTEKTAEKTTEKKSLKSRAVAATKKATKKAVVRKVSRRLTKNVHEMALTQLAANPQLAALIASPLGQLAVPAMLAVGLEMLPLPESIREQLEPFKDQLVEELTVQAIDDGTAPLEELAAALLPALKDVLPMLASANASVAQLAQEASAKDA